MRWTPDEFNQVETHPHLSAQELSELLPGRSVDAVECVRVGIERFHNGLDNKDFLSQPILRIMEERYPRVE